MYDQSRQDRTALFIQQVQLGQHQSQQDQRAQLQHDAKQHPDIDHL